MTKLQRLAVTPAQICPPHIVLTAEQQHYLVRVLRLAVGDRFIVMDGQHHWWLTQLEEQTARILEPLTVHTELPIAVTLLAALPKGNAFDDVVRQATEIGVIEILPMLSDRTLLHPSPQKLERWRRIAQEAAEQAERLVIPTIMDPLPFTTALSHPPLSTLHSPPFTLHRYICVTEQPAPQLSDQLSGLRGQQTQVSGENPDTWHLTPDTLSTITLATGPEGGWTDQEIERAIAAGFQPVSLGKRILRAVTAPVVALGLIAATLERRDFD